MSPHVKVDSELITEFCRKWGIKRFAFFGSVLRDDFSPESDIDVLVEFEPGHHVGLLRMAGLEIELTEIFGRKVDLRTPAELSKYFRDEIVNTSEVVYAQR